MPQMDLLILSSQISFVILFWFNYFIFLKTILPLISLEMKLKQKLILKNILWFKKNLLKTIFFKRSITKLTIKVRGVLRIIDLITIKKQIFFGIYTLDLLFLKQKY